MRIEWTRWKTISQATWDGTLNDDVMGRSAQLSYYFFLAHFPLLIVTISLLGIFAGPGQHVRQELIDFVYGVLPYSAAQLIDKTLGQVGQSHTISKLSFGMAILLWSASAGMSAIMDTLNSAYEVKETRSFLRRTLLAICLTVTAALVLLTAMAIIVGGGTVADFFTTGFINLFVKFIRWPIAVGLVLVAFALIYFVAPNVEDQKWRWVTPGTVMALALWAAASVVLKVYLHFFNSYSSGYGSLGAVIILLLWFYITGAAVLIGAELNHAIETEAAARGIPGARARRAAPTGDSLSRSAA